jgi:DNA polymerase
VRYVIYDAETRSIANLKQRGSHIYTCDPSTDLWCVSYCIVTDGERGPIKTWLPPNPVPPEILEATADPDTLIVAFNDAFERQVEERILHRRYGWPIFPLKRRRCAQATALSYALPASLERVAEALKLKTRKTTAGKRTMKLLAQPRKPRKGEDPTKIYWRDDPKLLETLYAYNRIDVEITAEIIRQLGFISPQEQKIWELDAGINSRGIGCDIELLDAALSIAEQADAELKQKIAALTDGEITGPAQTERIRKWLARHGCEVPNVQEETVATALKRPELSTDARQLIELRLGGAHAAVNKLVTLRD